MQNTGKLQPGNSSKLESSTLSNKFGSDIWLYALIAGGIMLVIMLVSASWLAPQVQSAQLSYVEDPLEKLPLQIKPGEVYRYDYTTNLSDQKFNLTLTYVISRGNGCTAIYIRESQNKTPTCINEMGNDQAGANVTLGNPLIYLFKPWMLAVKENWQWHTTAYLPLPTGELQVAEVYFRTVTKEIVNGRNAYKVVAELKIKDEPDQQITYWIDEKKRILLREEGPDYEIEITTSSLT